MNRRILLGYGMGAIVTSPLIASLLEDRLEEAASILARASASGQLRGAVMHVRMKESIFARAFGEADSVDAAFLLGSISKPIAIAALMTLYDRRLFDLDDPVKKYIPEFTGEGRDRVSIQHLLTHVSGLPDQLPENANLRQNHAPLSEFVKGAIRVPLGFEPGTRYEYSSMAVMLAAEIAQRLSGVEIKQFVDQSVLQPLGMHHSALGMGNLKRGETMLCQVEFGAVESGGGSPESQDWDWNSSYWRELGSPWGGVHASAGDVGRFLDEFMAPKGKIFQAEIARLMIRNHNADGITPRGLGFDIGMDATCPGCSDETFGHTGSTGTIAWADPLRDRTCVVLTTLPARASTQHPRQLVSDCVSAIP